MKYSDILRDNGVLAKGPDIKPYKVAVLSNITMAPCKEIFEYFFRVAGINAHVSIGNYDNILQDSQQYKHFDLVLIFWEAANVSGGFHYKSNLMSDSQLDEVIEKKKSEIDYVLTNLRETSLVIFNKFSSLIFNENFLAPNRFDRFCNELNSHIEKKRRNNLVLIEIDKVIARISTKCSADFRYFYTSKVLYSIHFLTEYAAHIRPIVLSVNGKAKKAFIFDCDNTLWKGVVGEDGLDGVIMSGDTGEGAIFEEVQALASDLNAKGTLIGLCSKNNSMDVEEVLKSRNDFYLNENNIAIKRVNWDDKAKNLEEIAGELNIGLDSMVFVDDSPFEVNYVKERAPEVTVLQVPKRIWDYPSMIREQYNLFFNLTVTTEDLSKNSQYKQQALRQEEKIKYGSIEEYLAALKLSVRVFIDDESLIPRIAQLTQKTNQFNLTTCRYTESEIQKLMRDEDTSVLAFRAADKYGDYGLVGVSILLFKENIKTAIIDSLLMSCRVIGRNIEKVFLDAIVKHISSKGAKQVAASYILTQKNNLVSNFYDSAGFEILSKDSGKTLYQLKVARYKQSGITYIEVNNGKQN